MIVLFSCVNAQSLGVVKTHASCTHIFSQATVSPTKSLSSHAGYRKRQAVQHWLALCTPTVQVGAHKIKSQVVQHWLPLACALIGKDVQKSLRPQAAIASGPPQAKYEFTAVVQERSRAIAFPARRRPLRTTAAPLGLTVCAACFCWERATPTAVK